MVFGKLLGYLVTIATFPGVMIHEFAHKLFCDLLGIKVHEVKYFRFGNPAGYVLHDRPEKYLHMFLISVGPFIFNTLGGALLMAFYFSTTPLGFNVGVGAIRLLLIWVGFSAAIHAFPSTGDAKVLFHEANKRIRSNFLVILGYPFVLLIWIANLLSYFWFDVIYAAGIFVLVGGLFF